MQTYENPNNLPYLKMHTNVLTWKAHQILSFLQMKQINVVKIQFFKNPIQHFLRQLVNSQQIGETAA